MTQPPFLTMERVGRVALPVGTTFFASLFTVVSLPISGYVAVAPGLTLMAIYCWSVWRPASLPYVAVFFIGIFEDLLRDLPVGLTALLLLICQAVIRAQQRHIYNRSFDIFWLGFALVALFFAVLQWAAALVLSGAWVSPEPGLFQLMLSVAIFPIAAWLLMRLGRAFRLAV